MINPPCLQNKKEDDKIKFVIFSVSEPERFFPVMGFCSFGAVAAFQRFVRMRSFCLKGSPAPDQSGLLLRRLLLSQLSHRLFWRLTLLSRQSDRGALRLSMSDSSA